MPQHKVPDDVVVDERRMLVRALSVRMRAAALPVCIPRLSRGWRTDVDARYNADAPAAAWPPSAPLVSRTGPKRTKQDFLVAWLLWDVNEWRVKAAADQRWALPPLTSEGLCRRLDWLSDALGTDTYDDAAAFVRLFGGAKTGAGSTAALERLYRLQRVFEVERSSGKSSAAVLGAEASDATELAEPAADATDDAGVAAAAAPRTRHGSGAADRAARMNKAAELLAGASFDELQTFGGGIATSAIPALVGGIASPVGGRDEEEADVVALHRVDGLAQHLSPSQRAHLLGQLLHDEEAVAELTERLLVGRASSAAGAGGEEEEEEEEEEQEQEEEEEEEEIAPQMRSPELVVDDQGPRRTGNRRTLLQAFTDNRRVSVGGESMYDGAL